MTVTYLETRACHICERSLPLVREFWVWSRRGELLSGCRQCRNKSKLTSYYKNKKPHVLPPVMNCVGCNSDFKPGHTACTNTKYCSSLCRERHRIRDVEKLRENGRIYRTRPEIRERGRLAAAQWRKDNPEYLKSMRLTYYVKWQYGKTREWYEEKLAEQNGACAICGTTDTYPHTRLSIDHCHKTGEVRGLLCHYCNIGIGGLKDNQDRLISAVLYLDKYAS